MALKRKLMLAVGLTIITVSANAETLVCVYPPNTMINNTIKTSGNVVSITGDRFVFKTDDGRVITSALTNCYIILQT